PASPDGVDVRMARSSSISGRVIDTNGEPVVGMAVSVGIPRTDASPTLVKVVGTDDLGEYRVGGLAAGTYVVSINPLTIDSSGFANRTQIFFPGVENAGNAQPMTLATGDQQTGVESVGAPSSTPPFAVAPHFATQSHLTL